ncbi:MAG: iron ABC transporter permease, partial [Planctomycetes bacterium]|nr:iron ABC transporter permease [Planctomycetota bacterium]
MTLLTRRRFGLSVGLCGLLLLAVLLVSPGVGPRPPGVVEAWRSIGADDDPGHYYYIAFQMRWPRALKALLAGVTLSLCGAVFQTLFRNPLATPYTLGIASGGSLGAMLAIELGLTGTLLWVSPVMLCAFAGSAAVVVAVAFLARAARGLSSNGLLLGGVTIGFFCSALMLFTQYLADERDAFEIIRWMMGSVATVGYGELLALAPFVVIPWLVLCSRARALDQYAMGAELAATRGVSPGRLQAWCIAMASVATAAIVSSCGPIGFVGLIVPHAARRMVGADHRVSLIVSGLLGGTFL